MSESPEARAQRYQRERMGDAMNAYPERHPAFTRALAIEKIKAQPFFGAQTVMAFFSEYEVRIDGEGRRPRLDAKSLMAKAMVDAIASLPSPIPVNVWAHDYSIPGSIVTVTAKVTECGATDHRHACTGSNEPGQPGSAYGPEIPTPGVWFDEAWELDKAVHAMATYGSVRLKTWLQPDGSGGLMGMCQSLTYDKDGNLTEVGEPVATGCSIKP